MSLDRFRGALGMVIAAALFSMALLDPVVAWFAIPAAIGGALVAGALFLMHRSRKFDRLEDATDAPDSPGLTGMINMATISPAGIGGLGLMAMAVFVALNYREGQVLLALGLTGGLAIAAALIRLRSARTSTRSR